MSLFDYNIYDDYDAYEHQQLLLDLKYPNLYPYIDVTCDDSDTPVTCIPNPYPWLKPCFEYSGYYYICGLPMYAINDSGNVINTITGRSIAKSINHRGYLNVALTINEKQYRVFIHRLVAYMFIRDTRDISKLQVNHINNQHDDNHVKNLEWVTQEENLRHYYNYYNDRKFIKVEVKDIYTGEITVYPNRIAAAIALGYEAKRESIEYKLSEPDNKIWLPGVQIRKYKKDNKPFPELSPKEIQERMAVLNDENLIWVRNVLTNEEYSFKRQHECANWLKISPSAITGYFNENRKVLPIDDNLWQLKRTDEPWEPITDIYALIAENTLFEPIIVIDKNGAKEIYLTAKKCAVANGLKTNTLNERLNQANPNKFWKDGKAYVRYKDFPGY